MAEASLLPDAFGSTWVTFVDEWCLGAPPVSSPDVCARALHALTEHWPEHVQALVARPTRGLGVVLGAIDLGLVLADTASLVGFGPVLDRLRAGERSAFSELTVGATFLRLGFLPALEVAVEGKVPDLVLTVGSTLVYAEVIAPNRSEIVKAATDQISEIAGAMLAAGPGGSVELFLDFDPDSVDAATLSRTIADSPYIEQPMEIPSVGRFVKRPFSFPPIVTPTIDSRTSGTVLGVARAIVEGENGALVAVRLAVFDGRAKRLLAGELHHFSKNSSNVLVIDSGGVPGGVSDWVPSITRCFQPNQNTRISAVVLYQAGIIGNPLDFHRTWKVLPNPHAANPLPKVLLDALTALPGKWPI
jgi:hypothetical protein